MSDQFLADSRSPQDSLLARITADPAVCGGRPCIRGMRVRVSDLVEMTAAGASFHEVIADFPYLEEDDLLAALAYAAQEVRASERIVEVR